MAWACFAPRHVFKWTFLEEHFSQCFNIPYRFPCSLGTAFRIGEIVSRGKFVELRVQGVSKAFEMWELECFEESRACGRGEWESVWV